MALSKSRSGFFESEEGIWVKGQLIEMANNDTYVTSSSYSANSIVNPGNTISFVDRHMNYLVSHPNVVPKQYLANIKIMTRKR